MDSKRKEERKEEGVRFFNAGLRAIEAAVLRGHKRGDLRWLIGIMFKRNIFLYSRTVPLSDIASDVNVTFGTFCGIPHDIVEGPMIERYGRYSARLYSKNGARTIAIVETSDTTSIPPEVFLIEPGSI